MTELNLSKTKFKVVYHEARRASTCHEEYVFHNMSVCHEIIINGNAHEVTYQNGHSYINNDYSAPSNKFQVYDEYSPLFRIIYSLRDVGIETQEYDEDFILEKRDEVKALEPAINSIDKLFEVYKYLINDVPRIEDFLAASEFSYDVKDYEETQDGLLIFKSKQ